MYDFQVGDRFAIPQSKQVCEILEIKTSRKSTPYRVRWGKSKIERWLGLSTLQKLKYLPSDEIISKPNSKSNSLNLGKVFNGAARLATDEDIKILSPGDWIKAKEENYCYCFKRWDGKTPVGEWKGKEFPFHRNLLMVCTSIDGVLIEKFCNDNTLAAPTKIIKAITLHQPWAQLVGIHKHYETRSWSTDYRGKLAIHAAQKPKRWNDHKKIISEFSDLLATRDCEYSAIVAIANLTDCIKMTEEFISQQSETEIRCGLWEIGRYAWKLENVKILSEPIPAKGFHKLWDIELSIFVVEESETFVNKDAQSSGLNSEGCVEQVLQYCVPGDVIGLGGWCILGQQPSYLTTFWETINNESQSQESALTFQPNLTVAICEFLGKCDRPAQSIRDIAKAVGCDVDNVHDALEVGRQQGLFKPAFTIEPDFWFLNRQESAEAETDKLTIDKLSVGDRVCYDINSSTRRGLVITAGERVGVKWDNWVTLAYSADDIANMVQYMNFRCEDIDPESEEFLQDLDADQYRWNEKDFGDVPRKADGDQLTIFFDDAEEPPLPEDFPDIQSFDKAWDVWDKQNQAYLTSVEKEWRVSGIVNKQQRRDGTVVSVGRSGFSIEWDGWIKIPYSFSQIQELKLLKIQKTEEKEECLQQDTYSVAVAATQKEQLKLDIALSGELITTPKPAPSSESDSQKPTCMNTTLENSLTTSFSVCPSPTASFGEALVQTFPLLANEPALMDLVDSCFLKESDFFASSVHHHSCLKTLRESLAVTKQLPSPSSSKRLQNWGMWGLGKNLMPTDTSLKTENEFIVWAITSDVRATQPKLYKKSLHEVLNGSPVNSFTGEDIDEAPTICGAGWQHRSPQNRDKSGASFAIIFRAADGDHVYSADLCKDAPTLRSLANTGKHQSGSGAYKVRQMGSDATIERPITPTEAEMLMGWEVGSTAIGIDAEGHEISISDTQRIKMLGNGIVPAEITNILERLKPILKRKLESEISPNLKAAYWQLRRSGKTHQEAKKILVGVTQ
jgi:hypothetical protein